MRAFMMNLNEYNANTQNPAFGNPTLKHNMLVAQMAAYAAQPALQQPVNVAGFVEVLVANTAAQANVLSALTAFGNALNIPGGGGRQFAVIRCGRTALQNSNEVVAIVIDGNALVTTYGLLWFDNPNGLIWQNQAIQPAVGNAYTSHLTIPFNAVPDYRYIVYINFTLHQLQYTVGFIHNRAPGFNEAGVVMQGIRTLLGSLNPTVALTMCGGDFNVNAPLFTQGGGPGQAFGHNHVSWYYSPGLTTVANRFDYWISGEQLFAPGGGTAASDATLSAPNNNPAAAGYTGSDHRGVGIDIA